MSIEPVYLDKDSLGILTRGFDLSEVLAAYADELGGETPSIDSFDVVEETGVLAIGGKVMYGAYPGCTFGLGGVAGTTYTVRLIPLLSNGDKPVVRIYVRVT